MKYCCPELKDLPPPPDGKIGWPWTIESPQLPDIMNNGRFWPKISIITPNYNYAMFIEETIRSVLLQGYPNLEYIIIDDGSTDNSVDVIIKYEPWLAYWETQPNRGQSSAINKGLKKATGDIIAWINSDDYYETQTFSVVAEAIDPANDRYLIMGDAHKVNTARDKIGFYKGKEPNINSLLFHYYTHRIFGEAKMPTQPSVFWHRKIFEDLGSLDGTLLYAMDYDYWLRAALKGYKFHHIPKVFSNYRFHPVSHSSQGWEIFHEEWKRVAAKHFARLNIGQRFSACFYITRSVLFWGLKFIVFLPRYILKKIKS